MSALQTTRADVVIIGAGIAGLWLAHRLERAGRSVVVLESNEIGRGQTVASQGIIHGGTKYALTNRLTGASEAISAMPARWTAALAGTGEIDLQGADVLSDCQYLWSERSVPARIATFFAASVMRNRVRSLPRERYPSLLAHRDFRGSLYQIDEIVLDVPSLLRRLAVLSTARLLKVDRAATQIEPADSARSAARISIRGAGPHATRAARLEAGSVICTAGGGSEELLARIGAGDSVLQRRPLHMVLLRGPLEHAMFGHCLGAGPRPRLTITSHQWDEDPNRRVWYLGGELAESGVERSREQQIARAREELTALFPWIDTSGCEWDAFFIDRVEGSQQGQSRPDGPVIHDLGHMLFAWPTKLAFAPLLADELIERIEQRGPAIAADLEPLRDWPQPEIAPAPWKEHRQWHTFDR